MDGWDIALLAVAGYVAVTALVALMRGHRDRLWTEFIEKLAAEERRKKLESKKQNKKTDDDRRKGKAA